MMTPDTKTPSELVSPSGYYKEPYILNGDQDLENIKGAVGPEIRQKWYQWFSPADAPEERRLLLKLDGLILVFVFPAYWAKTLDPSSAQTAYVNGMKEALKMDGNELNYLNTVY
ncbi:MFS transporter (Seo1), partial [Ascosphaera aggregata]